MIPCIGMSPREFKAWSHMFQGPHERSMGKCGLVCHHFVFLSKPSPPRVTAPHQIYAATAAMTSSP